MKHAVIDRQRGFAGILMLTIFGIVMVMMVAGAMRYIQVSQDAGVTVHSVTQSQIRAWVAVDAMRQFFYQSGAEKLETLAAGSSINFPADSGLTGQVVSVSTTATSCVDGVQLEVNLFGDAGDTTTGIKSIYCVIGSSRNLITYSLGSAVYIKGGLTLGGNIDILNGDNLNTSFYVEGNIDGKGSISGFSLLSATGNISLSGSQNDIQTVASEGNVTLSGSGDYGTVTAMGDISMSGGVNSLSAKANGAVTLYSSAVVSGSLTAIGDVTMNAGTTAGSVYTQGNVTATNASIGTLMAEGDVSESSNGSVTSGQAGGVITHPDWNSKVNVSYVDGLQVAISPLTANSVTNVKVDAWALKSAANLAFDHDDNGNVTVVVRNMNGINNGNYYLVGSEKTQDYLCDTPSYSSTSCYKKVCVGYSDSNSCFSYSSRTNTWSLNGSQFVPAILWFNGSVDVGSGTYKDTIIATLDIGTSGKHIIQSPNYAGYDAVCHTSNFSDFNASNLCGSGELTYNALANVALLAGGYQTDVFYGGDITLDASTDVYGSVVAGNLLYTGGSTTIYGYLTIAHQSGNDDSSSFKGSTTIDLSNLPAVYNPDEIIAGDDGGASGSTTKVTQLWSRYL